MGRRLYVGNLPYSTTEDQLRELFSAHGSVTDVHVATDRETGRPRGFAFVTLGSEQEAQAAVRALHDRDFGGRPLVVNEARERGAGPADRPPRPRPSYEARPPRAPRMPIVPLEPPPEEEGPRRRPRGQGRKPGPERSDGGRGRHHLEEEEDVSNWRQLLDEETAEDDLDDLIPFKSRKRADEAGETDEEEDWRQYIDRDEDDKGTLAERLRRDEPPDS